PGLRQGPGLLLRQARPGRRAGALTMRRALGIAVTVACTLTFPVARAATNPTAAPLCLPRLTAPPAGLDVTSSAPVKNHPRVTDVTFRSRALNGPVHADVLLPAGYDAPANATRR